MTGNVAMLIWLGKQHLGQQDKVIETQRDMSQLVEDEWETPPIRTADDAPRATPPSKAVTRPGAGRLEWLRVQG